MVLEFDHMADKDFNVSIALTQKSWKKVSRRLQSARWFALTVTVVEQRNEVASPAWLH